MKIGLVGWGLETKSAYNFFGPDHDYLIVSEEPKPDFPAESDKITIRYLDKERSPGLTGNVKDLSYMDGLEDCEKVIYTTPAAKNLEKKFGGDKNFWAKATTIQHIFFESVKTDNIIGITGTKGKGTTSTLVYDMLNAADKKAFLGGNIGIPVLDLLAKVQPGNWVVLELSNFQLYNLTYSPRIAVCLMIAPEHMDWHPDMIDYAEAKANLFRHQKPDDIAIYLASNGYSKKIAASSPGHKLPYYRKPGAFVRDDGMIVVGEAETEVIHKSEVKLLGEHNLQNICAALTVVWQIVPDLEPLRKVLRLFSGLEHRLEFVRELEGVKYYDDSFGTTPETAIVAIEAFEQPKIVILGGSDKGAEFEELAKAVKDKGVRHAIVVGAIADKITAALSRAGFSEITTGLSTMAEIVDKAREIAQAGDVVLLSAGAASFGMFKDYKDRGDQFKAAVQALV